MPLILIGPHHTLSPVRMNSDRGALHVSFCETSIAESTIPNHIEAYVPRSYETITLQDAKRMLAAAEAKADSIGIAYNIAIVDAGGHLVAVLRQDGALIGSIDLAIDKAVTARLFDLATSDLATLAQSGKPLFGIQESNAGKVVIFAGGIPVKVSGNTIGAVGASAGTIEQDIAVAAAAAAALPASNDSSRERLFERGYKQLEGVNISRPK